MAQMDLLELFRRWCPDRQAATFAHGVYVLGLSPLESAREAGYSCGNSDDPKKQRAFLSAAGSRALKTRRVQRLAEKYAEHQQRQDGEPEPEVATQQEVLARLTQVMRS